MEIDPMEIIETDDNETEGNRKERHKSKLNNYVALSIALLATFMGICKVKDDNIVQAMQQAQANKLDDWALYQARNIREEISKSTIAQLQLQSLTQPPTSRPAYDQEIAADRAFAQREEQKKLKNKADAENDQKTYDQLNFHDDQFDLTDASLSIAISLLALTSLSEKRWLFGVAMVPTAFGVVMGIAGLLSLNLHPDALTKLLSQRSVNNQTIVATTF